MALVNESVLKGYFNTGDKPSESTFIDVFDSVLSLHTDDNQTVAGETTFSDGIKIGNGTYSAPIKTKTVSLTLGTGAATTDTAASFIPLGAVPLAISVKVTTAITTDKYITSIGTTADTDAFCSGLADDKLEQLNDEVSCPYVPAVGTSFLLVDTAVRLTLNGTPAGGAVRISMTYIDGASIL